MESCLDHFLKADLFDARSRPYFHELKHGVGEIANAVGALYDVVKVLFLTRVKFVRSRLLEDFAQATESSYGLAEVVGEGVGEGCELLVSSGEFFVGLLQGERQFLKLLLSAFAFQLRGDERADNTKESFFLIGPGSLAGFGTGKVECSIVPR